MNMGFLILKGKYYNFCPLDGFIEICDDMNVLGHDALK